MPIISIDIKELSGVDEGVDASTASFDFWPYQPVHVTEGSDNYLLNKNILRVKTVEGVAAREIPETPAGNAMWVQGRGYKGADKWLVAIPSTDANLWDLTPLDSESLDPAVAPSPAWLAGLEAVQGEVTAAVDAADAADTKATSALSTAGAASTAAASAQGLATTADGKADTAIAGLAAKASNAALTSGLAGKVDNSTYTTGLAGKADTSALATKADVSALATKTDTTSAGRESLTLADYSKLRPWYAALAQRNSRRVNVGILGASLVEGLPVTSFDKTTAAQLSAILNARHPTSVSPGVVMPKHGRGIIGVPTAVMLAAGGWPQTYQTGTGGAFDDNVFNFGIKHRCWYTGGTDKITHTFTEGVTSFSIDHIAGSSGNATGGYYKINGGASVAFNTFNAATTFTKVTVAGTLAAGSTLEVGRAAANTIFSSITEYNGDESKGIQVHNLGHSSYSAAQWSVGGSSAGWLSDMAARTWDLMIIQDFPINDMYTGNGNKTVTQAKADLLALIALLRGAGITCPIVLVADYDTSAAFALNGTWASAVSMLNDIATADATITFADHSKRIPAFASSNPLGLFVSSTDPHGAADGRTYSWMAENLYAAIAPR